MAGEVHYNLQKFKVIFTFIKICIEKKTTYKRSTDWTWMQ